MMSRKRNFAHAITISVVIAVAMLLDAGLAAASRPGGGSSYSGGHSGGGGSSSGGGGGGDGIGLLIWLCFEHPLIGIPVVLVILFIAYRARSQKRSAGSEWSTVGRAASLLANPASFFASVAAPVVSNHPIRPELEAIRRTDPAFSIVVFEDFLYFLYAEMHRARGASGLDALAPYIADNVRAVLRGDSRITEVTGIIIGSLTYDNVVVHDDGSAIVTVTIESNYVERYRPHGEQRFFAKEKITLVRAAGARSRTPDKARTLNCPNCGGPLSAMRGTTCGYCHTQIAATQKDWAITSLQLVERELRGPLLTSNVQEEGTNLPTVVDPNAHAIFSQIQAKDPTFQWARLEGRIGLIFQEFHAGWVSRDPAKMRPFLSDNLFQSQLYWIDLYRAAKCINRTDGSRITHVELASATTDAFYDSVTVRLYATGLDFTISEDGKLLSGSQSRPRAYSEYWTLIRGAQKKPTDKGDKQCPNCGAPLNINMAGNCQYCRVKVTSGEYDWVLSRIEQDEAYTG
ncbi:MAG: TIM44-like domain-containing protein [Polyangiaceae bacterium]|nr:TIM44-like domain-containing protein [Polyangiaceae bacterium]